MKIPKIWLHNTNQWVGYSALVVLTLCSVINFYAFSDISVWRHDALYYEDSYLHKLSEEGRWLNYYLSDLLRKLPGQPIVAVIYASALFFLYQAAHRTTETRSLSLLIALIALQIPFLSIQILWPATLLPSFLVLAASALLVDKLPSYIFFPVFAVLSFATMSQIYFLLPLLFLRTDNTRAFLQLLIIWMASFVFGYLFSQAMTNQITGEFIEIANWRKPNPIESLSDFRVNLILVLESFRKSSLTLYAFVGPILAGIAILAFIVERRHWREFFPIALTFCSAIAVFVTMIPLGLGVAERTAWVFVVGLLFLILIRTKYSEPGKLLILLASLSIGVALSYSNYKAITWYSGVTETLKKEFERGLPTENLLGKRIVLMVPAKTWRKVVRKIEICNELTHIVGEGLSNSYRVSTILKEIGYRDISWCRNCKDVPVRFNTSKENCDKQIFAYKKVGPYEYSIYASGEFLQ